VKNKEVLADDMIELFKSGHLSDTSIFVDAKNYRCHKNILSAR
jgi:BTB/POZ domain